METQNKPKPVYILIPTINNYDFLIPCLDSIARNTVNYYKFIVINNGDEKLKDLITGDFKVINTGKNLGWSGGINAGLNEIKEDCDYVIFMNDDTLVLPYDFDWMYKFQTILDNDETVGAVGPGSNVVMGLQNMMVTGVPALIETKYLIGFCVMIRKKLFDDIGRMDESLIGGDDLDWSIRMRKQGYKLIARRDVFIYHHGFKTGDKVYKGYWNSQKMIDKVNNDLIKKHGFKSWFETVRNEGISYDIFKEEYGDENCLMPIVKGKGVDIGCGNSKITPETIGIDLVPKGEIVGEFGGDVNLPSQGDIVASGDNLFMFEDSSLDYIIARHNFEHYTNPIKTLKEWYRVLKPEGKLGMTMPDDNMVSSIRLDKTHKHSYNRETVKNLLELTGFKVLELGGCVNQWDFFCIAEKNG